MLFHQESGLRDGNAEKLAIRSAAWSRSTSTIGKMVAKDVYRRLHCFQYFLLHGQILWQIKDLSERANHPSRINAPYSAANFDK